MTCDRCGEVVVDIEQRGLWWAPNATHPIGNPNGLACYVEGEGFHGLHEVTDAVP